MPALLLYGSWPCVCSRLGRSPQPDEERVHVRNGRRTPTSHAKVQAMEPRSWSCHVVLSWSEDWDCAASCSCFFPGLSPMRPSRCLSCAKAVTGARSVVHSVAPDACREDRCAASRDSCSVWSVTLIATILHRQMRLPDGEGARVQPGLDVAVTPRRALFAICAANFIKLKACANSVSSLLP